MRWYEGDIAQAVTTSKSKNAIFVVYVEGKDEKSTNLTSHINNTDVSTKLESDNFVALKVEAGSVPHTQFEAIYKTVPVPSLFFIGKSGKPIDIITDSSSAVDLCARINSVIQTHTGVAVPTPAVVNTAAKQSESFIESEKQPIEAAKVENEGILVNVVCENGVCVKVPQENASTSTKLDEKPTEEKKDDTNAGEKPKEERKDDSSAFLEQEKQELSKEEKIERAKQLVEEKREAKRVQEEEDAKKKEIERRKLGQEVQKMQRSQQDQELKNLLEERQRVKNEEKAARDRILAQIAQDKADRAARFATPTAVASPAPQPMERPAASNSSIARLQFRLPDGVSCTHEFEASATLADVRAYITANLELPFRTYSLSTTFPRREFTPEDNNSTLRDLQLCPNAVIMILPAHTAGTVSSGEGGGFLSILWLLVTPILSVFGYFRSLIFGQPDGSTAEQPPERNKRDAEPETQPQQQQAPTKRKAMDSTVVRRQGNSNIHRLSDRTESDDDNNTWNGNSTQQM